MFEGIFQSVVILITAIVYYVIDVLLMRRFKPMRPFGSEKARSWKATIRHIILAGIMVAQPVWWPALGFIIRNGWWSVLMQSSGVSLIIIGLLLNLWARLHLGHFYSERSKPLHDHGLIDTGPYGYIRHPLYGAYFLMAGGILLVNPAVPTLLVAVYAAGNFYKTAKKEEALMTETVTGYREYMENTGRFFPGKGN